MAISVNDHLKLLYSAMVPINGGPNKNPINPMVEMAASAAPGDMVFDFPAALYTNGTTDDTPSPTSIKPIAAVMMKGKITASNKPLVIKIPLAMSTSFIPNLCVNLSLINLPLAIIPINDKYPNVTSCVGAATIF